VAYEKLDQTKIRYDEILTMLESIQEHNNSIINDINEKIDSVAGQFTINSKDNLSFQVFRIDSDVSQLILDRMQKYADWSYPGLRLGCRYVGQNTVDENRNQDNSFSTLLSNHMVALDPLYFCDVNNSLISAVTDHFLDAYKNRIRKYILDQDLSILPQNQFGFVFCWWVFNFMSIDAVKQHLKQIYGLLRPGGTLMFSYNNSDIFESARLVDMQIMSHTPLRHLIRICDEIGFMIESTVDMENSDPLVERISWIEIKKPGYLKTIKLQQVLGKIESIK